MHIKEMKAFKAPPRQIDQTVRALLLVLGVKAGAEWSQCSKALGDPTVLINKMKGFNLKAALPDQTLAKLETFVSDPAYTYEEISKRSLACAEMFSWMQGVY